MHPVNIDNTGAIARRAELQRRNHDLIAQIARLNAVKNERDSARAAVEELARKDAEALATWAINGGTGGAPEPDQKGRETAARKLAAAESQTQAVDQAVEQMTREHQEMQADLQRVGREIVALRARHIGRLLTDITARRREIEDERAVTDAIAGRLQAELFATDPRTGGDVTSELESLRVAWLNSRGAQIDGAVASRMAELAKDFPA